MKSVPLLLEIVFFTSVVLLSSSHFALGFASISSSSKTTSNPIITVSIPADDNDDDIDDVKKKQETIQFDSGCVANPVILPPSESNPKWQCYYYGNSGSWSDKRRCFLPTGSSGLAESTDGIHWCKIPGSEAENAMLTPGKKGQWDSVHTGVADVIKVDDNGTLHMYYFGADEEEISMSVGTIVGFRMRIGRAKSSDNGRSWTKDDNFIFDYDESEGYFASWPRIVIPNNNKSNDNDNEDQPWKMFYHAFNGKKWRVYGATSTNKGDTWERTGLVITGNEDDEDSFDYQGIGTRDVIQWKEDGTLLMIYEGVSKTGTHCLGAACLPPSTTSKPVQEWKKLNNGNPILEPGKGVLGKWTTQVIGTPFVVPMKNGALRVYHCGKENSESKMSIGVVESKTGNIEPECWEAIA